MKDEIKLWKEKTKGLFNIVEWTRFWNYITNLQEEKDRQLNNVMFLSKVADEKQEVIDKAIEYINNLSNEPNIFGHYDIEGNCKKYLLNILQGSDNNEI